MPIIEEMKRRKDAREGKRLRRKCVPRFCQKCSATLARMRRWYDSGRSRTFFGCPHNNCNTVYIQPDKRYMRLEEVGRLADAPQHIIRQHNRIEHRGKRGKR